MLVRVGREVGQDWLSPVEAVRHGGPRRLECTWQPLSLTLGWVGGRLCPGGRLPCCGGERRKWRLQDVAPGKSLCSGNPQEIPLSV
jgi:hypothetical protein